MDCATLSHRMSTSKLKIHFFIQEDENMQPGYRAGTSLTQASLCNSVQCFQIHLQAT